MVSCFTLFAYKGRTLAEEKRNLDFAASAPVLRAWAQRSDYQQVKVPPLSHYTDASGLIGVCSSNSLWATCAQYSNDRSEVVYARSVAENIIKETLGSKLSPAGERFSQIVKFMVSQAAVAQSDAYLISFCEASDLLSQWRAYGRDAGFEIRLESLTSPNALLGGAELLTLEAPVGGRKLLSKVIYDPDRQRSGLKNILERALSLVDEFAPGIEETPVIVATLFSLEWTAWLYTVKHPKFVEEQEWRTILFPEMKPVPPEQTLRAVLSAEPIFVYEHPERLKYRTGRQYHVVPYCEVFPMQGKLPIKEVICGPGGHAVLTAKAVRLLLASNGFTGVTVRNSDVPLAR